MKKTTNFILVAGLLAAILISITLGLQAYAELSIAGNFVSDELAGQTAPISYDYLNVRSEPNRMSDVGVLFHLEKGDEVTFTGTLYEGHDYKGNTSLDNWLEIQVEDGTAWINADAVRYSVDLSEYDFQPMEINNLPYIIAILVELLLFFIAVIAMLNKKISACKS